MAPEYMPSKRPTSAPSHLLAPYRAEPIRYQRLQCDIQGYMMCRLTFPDNTKLLNYVRLRHPRAITMARITGKSDFEIEAGRNAMKRWMLLH
ncbi:hypothetical protein N7457_007486 [Penicillium paradoxum]|uniref:uncharacterized protein n=1 Tax=Penicillium paradoxum TaxID=176176 RepID=UPI0025493A99|nr:uncharacterized protein N7457_007486 [Penicillium paradoxum]KAJ5779766.1 hypothetical protein N7457_007486 [Penicillium paradoxum]